MKLNLKISWPIVTLLSIVLIAFGYLLFYLNAQEVIIANEANKFRKLNSLGERLRDDQELLEYNILIFGYNQDPNAKTIIANAEIDEAKTIDNIYPFITTDTGKQLVDNYINSRKNIDKVLNDLLTAISTKNKSNINNKYNLWFSQTQNIRSSIQELNNYNLNSLNNILGSFKVIGDKLVQVILILFVMVIISFIVLFYYLKYAITNPIIKLSDYANEIAEKNFSSISDDNITRNDEIGSLFNAFSAMSKKLKHSYQDLAETVAQRTVDLTKRTEELEDSQKATLNILDDLSNERKILIETKAIDEAILASIGDALVVIDRDGYITFVNKAFEATTGWKAKEVLGKVLVDVVPSETENGHPVETKERFITKILDGENPESDHASTIYYVRKNKTRFPVNSLVKGIVIDGEMVGAVKTFRDITLEKDIDKAKTEFVSLAAHQLRTPLSAIGWYTEMLLSGDAGELTEMQKKYLDQIYSGNERMVGMVRSFLNVSRIELGTLQMECEETDVEKLLQSVAEEEKQNILAKEINMNFNFEKNIPKITIDPKKIRMVFQNLLSNAVKYTPVKGDIDISVHKSEDNKNLIFKFADTGFGIPENSKEKIFSKLFRAENVVEKATEGTGLGLYIVKNIVDNSGGDIWFESKENVGTTFYISLPM